jgi:exonuclease SbcC
MRPIRLEVKGFTAFREKCEIDFSTLDLFAITGQTGAGKTSLLDAITYALYGKTSRLNKAGRDLISQGANSMSVILHFRVGAEEYRVARTIQGATVTARLEKREDGEWRPTSGSITDVNDQIQRVVGLDFGGFTKTVILPQGKFDVFLRGEARERREVLSELLDVGVYQRMMKSANEKSKDAGIRAEERAANIDADATPEAKAEREQCLGELSEQEKAVSARGDKLRQSLTDALTMREKRTRLVMSQRELEETGVKLIGGREGASKASEQVEVQVSAIKDLDQQIESTPYDGDSHLRLNSLLPQAQQQRKLRDQLAGEQKNRENKNANLATAEKAAQAARTALDAATVRLQEVDGLRGDAAAAFKDLRVKHGSADAIQQIANNLAGARQEAADVPAINDQILKLEARAKTLTTEIDAATKGIEQAESHLVESEKLYERLHARDRATALRHELKPGEPCPVCEQTVHKVPAAPDAGKFAKARAQVARAKAASEKAQAGLLELRGEAQGVPGRLDVALKQLELRNRRVEQTTSDAHTTLGGPVDDAIQSLRALIKQIETAELGAQQAQSRHELVLKQQGETGTALQKAEHNQELTKAEIFNITRQIESCEQGLGALAKILRDAPALEEITKEISTLEEAKKRRAELETRRNNHDLALKQAEKALVECEKCSAALESERAKCEETIQALQKDIAKREKQLKKALGNIALAETPDEATQILRMEASSREELEALQAKVQKCQFGIDDLAKRIERNEKLRKELTELKAESALCRDLGTWLNAGNFQQYLLLSAFDILAREGSKHLKELSGGRYEFAFEGDEFVVNDHSNADETRSVKTLSGGESFLASLALALALAESITQLNGERGAVNLESLFLDEGFSTLDSESLSKVADAIEALQNGNRMIGIITHVQSLADQMPVRIEIEKTVSGSRIAQPRAILAVGL